MWSSASTVALHARLHHEARQDHPLDDCSNPLNIVKRAALLVEAGTNVPAPTPFVVRWYGKRLEPVLFQMDPGERCKKDCSSVVPQGTEVFLHAAVTSATIGP